MYWAVCGHDWEVSSNGLSIFIDDMCTGLYTCMILTMMYTCMHVYSDRGVWAVYGPCREVCEVVYGSDWKLYGAICGPGWEVYGAGYCPG